MLPSADFRLNPAGRANTWTAAQTFNDNVIIATSGKGIDFSATSSAAGGMSSELLDDYEEGTWSPTIDYSTSTTGLNQGTQVGAYTKVGNLVTFMAHQASVNHGSADGNVTLSLPIAASSTSNQRGWVSVLLDQLGGGGVVDGAGGQIKPGATTIDLVYVNGGAAAAVDESITDSSFRIVYSGTYYA
jgi:hypothetical protein